QCYGWQPCGTINVDIDPSYLHGKRPIPADVFMRAARQIMAWDRSYLEPEGQFVTGSDAFRLAKALKLAKAFASFPLNAQRALGVFDEWLPRKNGYEISIDKTWCDATELLMQRIIEIAGRGSLQIDP